MIFENNADTFLLYVALMNMFIFVVLPHRSPMFVSLFTKVLYCPHQSTLSNNKKKVKWTIHEWKLHSFKPWSIAKRWFPSHHQHKSNVCLKTGFSKLSKSERAWLISGDSVSHNVSTATGKKHHTGPYSFFNLLWWLLQLSMFLQKKFRIIFWMKQSWCNSDLYCIGLCSNNQHLLLSTFQSRATTADYSSYDACS